jgi:hypothetical protein
VCILNSQQPSVPALLAEPCPVKRLRSVHRAAAIQAEITGESCVSSPPP